MIERTVCIHALDTVDDCITQTVEAIADTDDADRAADLCERLNTLDTGKILLTDLLTSTANAGCL